MTIAITSLLILLAALAALFMSRTWAPLLTLAGFSVLYFFGATYAPATDQYIFWAIASLLAWGICFMLPKPIAASRAGVPYIAGGATAGALVGLIVSAAGLIIGSLLGAFLGALAYSRTPAGAITDFPSRKFFNYLCAKGLPAVIVACVFAIAIAGIFNL